MAATKKRTTKTLAKPKAKQPASVKAAVRPSGPRKLKPSPKRDFLLRKRRLPTVKLPSVWRLTKQAAIVLWRHKKLFIGITIIYGLLNLVLVQGLSNSTDVTTLKHQFDQAFKGNFDQVAISLSIFAQLLGSAGNSSSNTAGAYQVFLVLIASLAIIWSLRQVQAGIIIRARDAYYRAMYPLIPFILVLCVVGLQLLPLLIGSTIYDLVTTQGIAVHTDEKLIWALVAVVTALWSLYMISSSLFALYIVTLPDMTPMKALRSARELVRFRRWTVLRKVLFLPVMLIIVSAIFMVPIIIFLTPVAQWVFFILTMFALTAVHTYMYGLYRELLHE